MQYEVNNTFKPSLSNKISLIRKKLLYSIETPLKVESSSVRIKVISRSQAQRKIGNANSFKESKNSVKIRMALSDKLKERKSSLNLFIENDKHKSGLQDAFHKYTRRFHNEYVIKDNLKTCFLTQACKRIKKRLMEITHFKEKKLTREEFLRLKLNYMAQLAVTRRNCFPKDEVLTLEFINMSRTESMRFKENNNNLRTKRTNKLEISSCRQEHKEKDNKLSERGKLLNRLRYALEEMSLAPIEASH